MIAQISERDLISMKLLHYFITKKNYNLVVVQGVQNEIWLENLEAEYKIVRIVNNYIHNNEQMDFDVFKTKRMVKKIKRKTFSFKMKTLSILTDYGENVDTERTFDNVDVIFYENEKSLIKNKLIEEYFPDLKDNLEYNEEGFNLFLKITDEINQKNQKEMQETESILKPKKPIITFVLLGILSIIFIISFIYDANEIIFNFGNQRDLVRYGEYYRLLTCAFIHTEVIHFLANAYALYVVGSLVEGYYGKLKFILIYLVSAITGSLLSMIMSQSFSIGASGAIFGLMGSLLYFGYHYRVYFGNVLISKILPVVIFNLFLGFMMTGIDNFAHIGGLVGGFLISKAVGINSKDKKTDKINGLVLSIIFMAFLIYLGIIMV